MFVVSNTQQISHSLSLELSNYLCVKFVNFLKSMYTQIIIKNIS